MKVIKKYTAVQVDYESVGNRIHPSYALELTSKGPYGDSFDTEQEAIEFAHKTDRYATWLIIPQISFDHIAEDNESV